MLIRPAIAPAFAAVTDVEISGASNVVSGYEHHQHQGGGGWA